LIPALQFFKIVSGLLKLTDKVPKGVIEKSLTYPGLEEGNVPVKVIEPKSGCEKIFIIFPGASPFAEEHPETTKMAYLIAGMKIRVYLPRIPLLKDLIISTDNAEWMVHFYQWVINKEKTLKENIYIIGMSFGGALLLKATLKMGLFTTPPVAIMTYGTFYNFDTTFNFLTTGVYHLEETKMYIQPHDWGAIVILNNYLKYIDTDYDKTNILKNISYLINDEPENAERHRKTLPKFDQKYLSDLIESKHNHDIKHAIDSIKISCKEELYSLSPKYWYENIIGKVFILHGLNDNMIPYTESVQLSKSIDNSEILISKLYGHNSQDENFSGITKIKEAVKLVTFLSRFIGYDASSDIPGRL
jgi:hypothetical protein